MEDSKLELEGAIQKFYKDKTVFMTGATGFLGMVLLEKLLRSCSGIRKIYLLMRPKKSRDIHQRLLELLNDPLFYCLTQEHRHGYRKKVVALQGDCSLPLLGLSEEDQATLHAEVHVVFHVAATVRFDEPLRVATGINVRGTREVLRMAQGMDALQALVHVSTAYAHCPESYLEERFYPPPMTQEELLNTLDSMKDEELQASTKALLGRWPNTYTFTKAIAEDILHTDGTGLPICIVRPSMVINAASEPTIGWNNNARGLPGAALSGALGILRTVLMEEDLATDVVPVDFTSNLVITVAWSIASTSALECDVEKTRIYNMVSSARNPITWGQFIKYVAVGNMEPSKHTLWYYCMFTTSYPLVHKVQKVFLHYLPAVILDAIAICLRKEPQLLNTYKRLHRFLDATAYFSTREWQFRDANVQQLWSRMCLRDKKLFQFDVAELSWENTISALVPGLTQFFLKENVDSSSARTRYRRLKIIHYSLVTALWLIVMYNIMLILNFFI